MEGECLGIRGERFPEAKDRVQEDAIGKASLRASAELEGLAVAGLHDEPQLDERAVDESSAACPPRVAGGDVGAQENFHVPLQQSSAATFLPPRVCVHLNRAEVSASRVNSGS